MKCKKFTDIKNEDYVEEDIMEILISQLGEFSTIDVLAETLTVSRATIYRAIDSGKIVALHFGSRVIIVTRSLENTLELFC